MHNWPTTRPSRDVHLAVAEVTDQIARRSRESRRAYLERIPVITIDGEEAFELFVDEAELIRRLDRVHRR